MSNNSTTKGAIIFAAVLVTIALAFNGYAMLKGGSGATDEQIKKAVEDFAKKPPPPPAPTFIEGDFSDDDAILGDKNAPVTIIEWSDYECPFCKRHFTNTFPQIKEKYIDTGKVRYIFRDYPLGFHNPNATEQAIAAECARDQGGDEMYFTYHDLIFTNTNSNKSFPKSRLYELADEAGLNQAEFTECLDSEKFKGEVLKDLADGGKAGVTGTPGFLINGQVLKGAQPFSAFEAVIEAALAK